MKLTAPILTLALTCPTAAVTTYNYCYEGSTYKTGVDATVAAFNAMVSPARRASALFALRARASGRPGGVGSATAWVCGAAGEAGARIDA